MKTKLLLHLCIIGFLTAITAHGCSLFDLQSLTNKPAKLAAAVKKLSKYTKEQRAIAAALKYSQLDETIRFSGKKAATSLKKLEYLAFPGNRLLDEQSVEKATLDLTRLAIVLEALSFDTTSITTNIPITVEQDPSQTPKSISLKQSTSPNAPIIQATDSREKQSPTLALYSGTPFWGITVKSKNLTRPKDQLFDQNHNNETFSTPKYFIQKQSTTRGLSTLKLESTTATTQQQPERPKSPLNLFGHHGNNSTSNNFDFENDSSERGPVDFSAGQTQESW